MYVKSIFSAVILFISNIVSADDHSSLIQVYGHRGARTYSPENTIPGYRTALNVGVNWIDADIVISKDHQIFAYHDLFLNPNITRDENGNFVQSKEIVYNLTAKQLQTYDVGMLNPNTEYAKYFPFQVPVNGTKIPLLEEVISYVNKNSNPTVNFQLEIKTDPDHDNWSASPEEYAKVLYGILKKYRIIDRVEIHAFDWRYLYALQNLDKRIKTGYLVGYTEIERMQNFDPRYASLWTGGKLLKNYNNSIPQMVKALGGCCYEPEDVTLTKAELDEAHRLGLKVVVWTWPEHIGTAFDADLVARLIEWGVDGIITDDPGRLNSMLAARKYRVPQNYPAR